MLDFLSDDPRDAFVGTWDVSENNNLKKSVSKYIVEIDKSFSDSTAIFIKNFYELGKNLSVKGIVTDNRVNIPSQNITGFIFQGYGSVALNGKTIGWSYTVDYQNGFIDQVTATYTLQ